MESRTGLFNNGFGAERFGTLCLASLSLGHITADKRLRYASPKLPSATSFTRNMLYEIPNPAFKNKGIYPDLI